MEHFETEKIVNEELLPRWPDWKPSGVEIADWRYAIRPFDVEIIKTAIRRHVLESSWKKPVSKKIIEKARSMQPNTAGSKKETPEPTIFVQCVEQGGELQQFSTRPACQPGIFYSADTLRDAEKIREKLIGLYGGMWDIIQQATYGDMIKRRIELRKQHVQM